MSPPAVVIAEDEPRILRSLCFMVDREGGRAVPVTDGHQAVEAVRRERPVLVILDVMMPGLTGYEVCRRLRDDPDLFELPIVILTALGQAEHEQEALAAGATRYLRKPFDPRELRDLIAASLTGPAA